MARKLRLEYPGAIYHVMNRGDRREAIYQDDGDRIDFISTMGNACEKTGWQVHAFCLMANHFHAVIETPSGNLVAGMKWLLGTYTTRFNRRHRLVGHLFSGRYKALIVDGSGNGYLRTVCDYVHLNPSRAKLLPAEEPLQRYPWSSWPAYLKSPKCRWPWLRADRLIGEYGLEREGPATARRMEIALESRRADENGVDYRRIRQGWYFGTETFREQLLAQAEGKLGKEHYGDERNETVEAKAERLVAEELTRRTWTEADLGRLDKNDPGKLAIALRLRAETVVAVGWIAERLQMGTLGYLNHLLYLQRKTSNPPEKNHNIKN